MRELTVILKNANEEHPKRRLDRVLQISQIFSLMALPLLVAGGGWWIQRSIASSQVEQKYVELALSILREPAEDGPTSLREWGARTLARYSKVPFSDADLKRLSDGTVLLPSSYVITQKNPDGTVITKTYDPTGKLVHEHHEFSILGNVIGGGAGRTYKPDESPEKLEIKPAPSP